jgi:hypothetical protein
LVLTVGFSIRPQEVGWHKPSRPRVPEDAVDRAAWQVAAEEKKKKKDEEKARARECDFSFLLSKRSHGLTDLAPRKALKTASASAAGAVPGLAVQLTFSHGAP